MIEVLTIRDIDDARRAVRGTGADEFCIDLMASKALSLCLRIPKVKMPAANILKQEMLAVGAEAAVHRGVIDGTVQVSDVVIIGNVKQVLRVARKLKDQPFGLKSIASELEGYCLSMMEPRPAIWRCRERCLHFDRGPLVMGVLNVTPDSFSDGGRFYETDRAIARGLEMAEQGADIIDVGGESTRPGAEPVPEEEELKRVLPVIEALSRELSIPISVDTYKSGIARRALEAGASIINDISGLRFDPEMGPTAAKFSAGLILMHIQGTPKDMQQNPCYGDVVSEVRESLAECYKKALECGVEAERVALDPGIGFGKNVEHNLKLLNNLGSLRMLGRPIVVGVSRKSFIARLGSGDEPEQRLSGSLAAALTAVSKGARVLRVHDVAETKRALIVYQAIMDAGW